jgi:glycosyltransferase involved in cell wall biosynthesis
MTAGTKLPQGSVWVDVQGAQSALHPERGIARYIAEQTKAMTRLSPDAIGGICLDPELELPPSLAELAGHPALRWRPRRTARLDETPPIYHVMSPFELDVDIDRIRPAVARRPGVRTAVTLYDLIPLLFREGYLAQPHFTALYFGRLGLIAQADHVFTISQATADDAVEQLGIPEERITVIDCGVAATLPGHVSDRESADAVLSESGIRPRDGFLFYVGAADWRKNLEGLVSAYGLLPERLRAEHQLVLAGRLPKKRERELRSHAAAAGLRKGELLLTGLLSDEELVALYRTCGLFVFPSLYEGAGLPVLEAMSCDAPVAASCSSSIPEILGDLEATFDPADPSDIARCLEETLTAPGRLDALRERSRRRAAVFTWERVARLTLEGYERALELPTRAAPRPARKRLAVITPWPPQASGVADHSRELVAELAKRVDVDVVVPREAGVEFDRSLEPQVRLWSELDFDAATGFRDFDRLLYVFGNSRFHIEILKLFERRPGAALMHDVRLVGLYEQLSWEYLDPRWLGRKVAELYGDVPPDEPYMTREIQSLAETVLLHSETQAQVLRAEDGLEAPPISIVPLGIRTPPPVASLEPEGGRGPLVVSYGIADVRVKRLDLVIEAFAALRRSHPDARLAIVGQIAPGADREVERLAGELGVGGAVELHGRVGPERYWGTLAAADLAVQLRTGAQGGEASAAVCDCIAARVPTIVSDIGWFGELPDGVALKLPESCAAGELTEGMASLVAGSARAAEMRSAQDRYAEENSFARVAERYVEVLEL